MSAQAEVQGEVSKRLVHEFGYTAELEVPVPIGPGPYGERMFVGVSGGVVTGERINGVALPGGGDWLLLGGDGFARLDVRGQMQTDDGAVLYISYAGGLLEATPAVLEVLGGGEVGTEFGDPYFVATPRLETGDPRYSWVNQTAFVSVGRVNPGPVVEFRVSRVVVEEVKS